MSCALASTEWQKKSEETILMLTVWFPTSRRYF
jgi:hypothetical protein